MEREKGGGDAAEMEGVESSSTVTQEFCSPARSAIVTTDPNSSPPSDSPPPIQSPSRLPIQHGPTYPPCLLPYPMMYNVAPPPWHYYRPPPPWRYYPAPRPYGPRFPIRPPRMELLRRLTRQLDYYFSADNLSTDDFLRSIMDEEGWVAANRIVTFNMIARLTNDPKMVVEAARDSNVVENQREKIRKKDNWKKWPSLATVPLELLPSYRQHAINPH